MKTIKLLFRAVRMLLSKEFRDEIKELGKSDYHVGLIITFGNDKSIEEEA